MTFGIESYHFTESEVNKILKSLVYLVDTREKEAGHVVSAFEKKGLKWKYKALTSGDYSVMIPKNEELGIFRDIYFDSKIVIERKNSLDELANNLGNKRVQFEHELFRTPACICLVVEGGSYEKILNEEYNSLLTPKSYYRSLVCMQAKYNLKIHFIPKKLSGFHIQQILECFVKESLNL